MHPRQYQPRQHYDYSDYWYNQAMTYINLYKQEVTNRQAREAKPRVIRRRCIEHDAEPWDPNDPNNVCWRRMCGYKYTDCVWVEEILEQTVDGD